MKPTFYSLFNKNRSTYSFVRVTKEELQEVRKFTDDVVVRKDQEVGYRIDRYQKKKRFGTGFSGETAVGKLIGRTFTDLSVGESRQFNVPDLSELGLNVGVKTVEMGKFPLVLKYPRNPEIIVVKDGDYHYICGIASVATLKACQDDRLVLSASCLQEGRKTAFYGLDQLVPFSNFEELVRVAESMGAVNHRRLPASSISS